MIRYIIQVICPFNYKVIFEYYCTTKTEAEWLAKAIRDKVTVEVVKIGEL